MLAGCSGGGEGATSEAASGSDSGGGEHGAPAGSTTLDSPAQARADDASDSLADDAQSFNAGSSSDGRTSEAGDTVDGTGVTGPAGRVPVEAGLYIRTGRVTLVSDDLESARASLERTVRRYGGQVASEQTD